MEQHSTSLVDLQFDAKNSYLFTYNTFIKILYMFRTLPCSSTGGPRRDLMYIRILCIKLEINQVYTTLHGQPIINTVHVSESLSLHLQESKIVHIPDAVCTILDS